MTFVYCNNLETVGLPDNLTEIGDSAFMGCKKLSSVELPEGLKVVEESAFCDCENLSSLYLPSSVQEVGKDAFGKNGGASSATGYLHDIWIYNPQSCYIHWQAFGESVLGTEPRQITFHVGTWAKGQEEELADEMWLDSVAVTIVAESDWTDKNQRPTLSTPAKAQNTATRNNR